MLGVHQAHSAANCRQTCSSSIKTTSQIQRPSRRCCVCKARSSRSSSSSDGLCSSRSLYGTEPRWHTSSGLHTTHRSRIAATQGQTLHQPPRTDLQVPVLRTLCTTLVPSQCTAFLQTTVHNTHWSRMGYMCMLTHLNRESCCVSGCEHNAIMLQRHCPYLHQPPPFPLPEIYELAPILQT